MIDAHFKYFSNSKQNAAAMCDNFIAQAKNNPKGANPIWFKYKLPKSFTPLLNMPGMLCAKSIIDTDKRSKKVLFVIFIIRNFFKKLRQKKYTNCL